MGVDGAVALALTIGALAALSGLSYRGPTAVAMLGCLFATTAVAYRRAAPAIATIFAVIGVAAYQRVTYDQLGACEAGALVLTAYMLGRRVTERRVLVIAGACTLVGVGVASATGAAVAAPPVPWIPMVLAPAAVGMLVTRRERLADRLTATLSELEAEQVRRGAQAAIEERNRVARDLHDVVAHGVSVMVIQAGAARLVSAEDPAAALGALTVVEDAGREAMTDLRRVMGVLRRDEELTDVESGLARLEVLVARVRAAGFPTNVDIAGRPESLSPAIDLVAYRVVQEALTNVVKHAGRGANTSVQVRVDDAGVDLGITNAPGQPPTAAVGTRSGHGLGGMRERITLYGGRLDKGTTADGGYCVHAWLPRTAPLTVAPTSRTNAPVAMMTAPRDDSERHARFDRAIAAACFVALEIEAIVSAHRAGPLAANMIIVGAMTVAAVWRRRTPLLFLAVVGSGALALGGGLTAMEYSTVAGAYSVALPLYAVAAYEPMGRAVLGVALWAGGATIGAALWHAPLGGLGGALIMAGAVWVVGRVVRGQRSLVDRLTGASALLAAERAEREQLAIANERSRIARDLHTLVSDDVVAMVVQAEAARGLLGTDPRQARAAIEMIECTGRDALRRLRDILGVLRAGTADRDPDGAVV